MRVVIQRVSQAKVEIGNQTIGQIDAGLLVYLSVGNGDNIDDCQFIADKLSSVRIFEDDTGKMNRSVREAGGSLLIISNFTLHGDCRKGRRPSFDNAAEPQSAKELYEKVIELIASKGLKVEKGIFGENMQVSSLNNGPVTILLDSKRLF